MMPLVAIGMTSALALLGIGLAFLTPLKPGPKMAAVLLCGALSFGANLMNGAQVRCQEQAASTP